MESRLTVKNNLIEKLDYIEKYLFILEIKLYAAYKK